MTANYIWTIANDAGVVAPAPHHQRTVGFRAYLEGVSPNVQDPGNQIPRLSRADAPLIEKLTSPDINLSPAPMRHADCTVKSTYSAGPETTTHAAGYRFVTFGTSSGLYLMRNREQDRQGGSLDPSLPDQLKDEDFWDGLPRPGAGTQDNRSISPTSKRTRTKSPEIW